MHIKTQMAIQDNYLLHMDLYLPANALPLPNPKLCDWFHNWSLLPLLQLLLELDTVVNLHSTALHHHHHHHCHYHHHCLGCLFHHHHPLCRKLTFWNLCIFTWILFGFSTDKYRKYSDKYSQYIRNLNGSLNAYSVCFKFIHFYVDYVWIIQIYVWTYLPLRSCHHPPHIFGHFANGGRASPQ